MLRKDYSYNKLSLSSLSFFAFVRQTEPKILRIVFTKMAFEKTFSVVLRKVKRRSMYNFLSAYVAVTDFFDTVTAAFCPQ